MKNKNDVVIIELDRPRELRFGHKALKRMAATSGKSMEEMESDAELNFDELEQIFFYGLERDARENGETLKLEDMEDILDFAESYDYLIEKMKEAMSAATGNSQGNNLAPKTAQPNRKTKNGTGKKA